MKLVSYSINGHSSYGILNNDAIVDLKQHLGSRFPDLKSLLQGGIGDAEKLVGTAKAEIQLEDVELLPVIPNPGAVWCAGMNTHSHFIEAAEHMGLKDMPAKPVLFLRHTQSLVGSGQDMEKPRLESAFDYEGEIALVIGKRARNVSVETALDYVAGYSCFNDGTARNYQVSSNQITAGKNAYRSGGFGPCLATPDEVDLDSMTMTCRVNGQEVQQMRLDDLIFGFAELISFISEFTWLEPGDVIVTGSPEGVGILRGDPRALLQEGVLQVGDKVEVEVSGVGTLLNGVREQV